MTNERLDLGPEADGDVHDHHERDGSASRQDRHGKSAL